MRHLKLTLFLILICTALVLWTGCSSQDSNKAPYVTNLAITDAMDQPVSSAPMGAIVNFTISVTNPDNKARTITLPSSAVYEVQVLDSNNLIVYRSVQAAAAVITHLPFAPGQTHTYQEAWNQHSSGDPPAQLPAGTYRAYALINGDPSIQGLRSAPVNLQIAPTANN